MCLEIIMSLPNTSHREICSFPQSFLMLLAYISELEDLPKFCFQGAVARRVTQKPHICTGSPYQHHQCCAPSFTGMIIEDAIQLSPDYSYQGLPLLKCTTILQEKGIFSALFQAKEQLELALPSEFITQYPQNPPLSYPRLNLQPTVS